MGTPELPGVRRRVYYTSKNDILVWPKLPHNEVGRVTSSVYDGSFTLKENAVWKYIDILPEKSQLTSEAQGELPSQTQLNKLVAVHPSVSEAASAAAAYLNNNDNVFIVEDMKGKHRVVGCDKWDYQDHSHAGSRSGCHWHHRHHYQRGGIGRVSGSVLYWHHHH